MDNLIAVTIIGFFVLAFLLYDILVSIGKCIESVERLSNKSDFGESIRKIQESLVKIEDIQKSLEKIEEVSVEEFSWRGRGELLSFRSDIIKAFERLESAVERIRD